MGNRQEYETDYIGGKFSITPCLSIVKVQDQVTLYRRGPTWWSRFFSLVFLAVAVVALGYRDVLILFVLFHSAMLTELK